MHQAHHLLLPRCKFFGWKSMCVKGRVSFPPFFSAPCTLPNYSLISTKMPQKWEERSSLRDFFCSVVWSYTLSVLPILHTPVQEDVIIDKINFQQTFFFNICHMRDYCSQAAPGPVLVAQHSHMGWLAEVFSRSFLCFYCIRSVFLQYIF